MLRLCESIIATLHSVDKKALSAIQGFWSRACATSKKRARLGIHRVVGENVVGLEVRGKERNSSIFVFCCLEFFLRTALM
jgi:hypothetical protein